MVRVTSLDTQSSFSRTVEEEKEVDVEKNLKFVFTLEGALFNNYKTKHSQAQLYSILYYSIPCRSIALLY